MKTTITESEKMQLLGLLTLAIQHRKVIEQAENAMCKLLEHDDMSNYADHLSDAIYDNNTDIDTILKNMDIEVTA